MKPKKILVLGAGGFIGGHLCQRLIKQGHIVRGVDRKYNQFFDTKGMEFVIADLRDPTQVKTVFDYDLDEVYQLSAEMGGAGYVFTGKHDADIFANSAMINLNVANIAVKKRAKKLFFSSSACAYSQDHQKNTVNNPLSEKMAYPANPDSDYGWEKLMSERLYLAYHRNYGLDVRIARFHNIYGEMSEYYTGREKAPSAMCRKVILAGRGNDASINIWGTGKQMRSFLHINDCLDAVELLMESDYKNPINIGSAVSVTIDDLANMVIGLSKKKVKINHIEGPIGVAGRSSDNTLVKSVLDWKPKISLRDGLDRLYTWMVAHMATLKTMQERNPDTGEIRSFINYTNVEGKVTRYYLTK